MALTNPEAVGAASEEGQETRAPMSFGERFLISLERAIEGSRFEKSLSNFFAEQDRKVEELRNERFG